MIPRTFLRENDKLLIDLLYRFKVATVDDIRELVYQGIGKNHVYARLKELIVFGFIQRIPYKRDGKYLSAYSLTNKAFKTIICDGETPLIRKEFLSGKVDHDLGILSVYKKLKNSQRIAEFIPENVLSSGSCWSESMELQEWVKHRPDGIIIEENSNDRFYLPLEFELSIKGSFRYETKLIHYYNSSNIPAVLYVCGDWPVLDFICRVEKKYCEQYRPKVFYACLSQLQNESNLLTFTNREGGKLSF